MDLIRRGIETLRHALVKRAWLLRVLALIGTGALMTLSLPNPAEACGLGDIGSCVAMIFVKIFQLLTALMGWIMVLEVDALIRVAQYHNFVNPGPSAVQVGWVVTRDLANMFFIVILLIIAFGTILGSSTYHYEKNLPRLLIMAVVINFSKTICGIFIDMGQVVMLTFVNGFKEAAGGNFVNAFQVNKLLALGESGGGTYTFGMVVAMMFAFILTTIAVSVILVMLVIMIFRIVILWVLIILSPIAFLTSAVPKGGDYYAQWWKEFKKYIITGPIIAFFLWLALASVQKSAATGGLASEGFEKSSTASQSEATAAERIGDSQIPSEAGASSDTILNMIIAICLMFAGLKFASESGVVGAGVASSVRSGFEKGARGIARYGVQAGLAPIKAVGGAAANRAKQGAWGMAGSLATRVPGLRGLGVAAKAREEGYKEKRRASIEKFTGTEAQKSQFLKPETYANRVAGMSDPSKQMEAFKLGMANPATAAAMFAKKKGKDGNEYTQAGVAMANVLKTGSDKEFLEMADLSVSNRGVNAAVKDDPEIVGEMQKRYKSIADKDPNQMKGLGAFNQKYVSQLSDQGLLNEEDRKKMVPKIPMEDIPGMDARGLELLAPHMTDAQLAKAAESAANDPAKDAALKSGMKKALDTAKAGGDDRKIAAAALRSISVGSLDAGEIEGDVSLKGSIGRGMDAASYAKNVDRSDSGQMAAATAAFASFKEFNGGKARGLAKHDQYQDFGMTTAAFAADDKAKADAEIEKKSADEAAATKVRAAEKSAEIEKRAAEDARATLSRGADAMAQALKRSDTLDKSRGQGGPYEAKNREESARLKGAAGSYGRAKADSEAKASRVRAASAGGTPADVAKAEKEYKEAMDKLVRATKDMEDTLKG